MFVTTDYQKMFNLIDLEAVFNLTLASILLVVGSFFIIRLSGKKSIAQMTMPQFVITLGLGNLIAQPLQISDTIMGTYLTVGIFVLVMVVMERLAIKSEKMETILDSVPIVLVEDGKLQEENLKKARYTVDQLESMLRQLGIKDFRNLKTCTVEVNGKLGYEKKEKKENVTNEYLDNKLKGLSGQVSQSEKKEQNSFDEVKEQKDLKQEGSELD